MARRQTARFPWPHHLAQPSPAFLRLSPDRPRRPGQPGHQNLIDAHATLAAAGAIDAWFWGHEHRLRLYAPYRGIAVGRNIGYGAIPVSATTDADTSLPSLLDPPHLSTNIKLDVVDGAYTHGFALLDLAPEAIDVTYWAVTRPSAPIHRETLSPTPTV